MFPLHTWLPDAHVQAPTGGSILLAGILIKIGGYGFLRLSLPFFPLISSYFSSFVIGISLIGVIYASLIALNQTDIKKLIAYSSIAHMGFTTAGIFSLNTQGIEGGMFQMLSHGIISAALFLSIGILYERKHTREMEEYNGLAWNMPIFSILFFILTLGSIGLPGTSGFIGEFLAVLGVLQYSIIYAVILSLGIVLGAWYMLFLNKKIIWGKREESLMDINSRELIAILPLVILEVVLGLFPNIILHVLHAPVARIIGSF